MATYNRNINYKGGKLKVTYNVTKDGFIINGILYPVLFESNEITCRNGSIGLAKYQTFNGVRIPMNDKRIIEMIFNHHNL